MKTIWRIWALGYIKDNCPAVDISVHINNPMHANTRRDRSGVPIERLPRKPSGVGMTGTKAASSVATAAHRHNSVMEFKKDLGLAVQRQVNGNPCQAPNGSKLTSISVYKQASVIGKNLPLPSAGTNRDSPYQRHETYGATQGHADPAHLALGHAPGGVQARKMPMNTLPQVLQRKRGASM